MNVLFVASEAVPFSKTGGLADVAFALPKALRQQGVDARVIIPKTFEFTKKDKIYERHRNAFSVDVGWRQQYVGLIEATYEDVPYYFIDNRYYFHRDNMYGYYDDGERFAYYSRAVLEAICHMNFEPDILHLNDWHTGMIPVVLNEHYRHHRLYKNIKTVFTIHNLKYQGIFDPKILGELFNLDTQHFDSGGVEFNGALSFMKAGIQFSHMITTVSPTYAGEIQYPFFGEGLEGLLQHRSEDLQGILNGLDQDIYNTRTDSYIASAYDKNTLKNKEPNKKAIQEELGLPQQKDIPLMIMVTRLADMKGLDLVERVMEEILAEGIQFVILGTGDDRYENMLRHYQWNYPDQFRGEIGFNVELAHRLYAGADMLLMPSLFEPCGLTQLIGLRYGTLPIVRETGGLKDTVDPYNEYEKTGNGFGFANYNAHEMLFKIKEAIDLYRSDRPTWNHIVKQAMSTDSTWEASARLYREVYEKALRK